MERLYDDIAYWKDHGLDMDGVYAKMLKSYPYEDRLRVLIDEAFHGELEQRLEWMQEAETRSRVRQYKRRR